MRGVGQGRRGCRGNDVSAAPGVGGAGGRASGGWDGLRAAAQSLGRSRRPGPAVSLSLLTSREVEQRTQLHCKNQYQ